MKKNGIIQKTLLWISILLGAIVRTSYVLYTPTWVRQHDVIGFGNDFGQAAYIEYFYKYHKLPDFDPRTVWGFFQPPLHHILAALWIKLGTVIGISYDKACENVHFLTLLYGFVLMLYAYRIFRQLKLSGMKLVTAMAIVSMHPSYIMMSGSINNDMLCILLSVMAVFCFLRWNESGKYSDMIRLALCVGCSMMAKLSGVLIAPALAAVFLYKWINGGKDKFWIYLKQFLLFGVLSIPLGMWSPLRNYMKFGVPFDYTPPVGEPLAVTGVISRLCDIRTSTPFACMITNGDQYNEYNIPLAMMKTSLTGEWNLTQYTTHQRMITLGAWILLLSGTLLAVFAVIMTVRVLIDRKKEYDSCFRLFMLVYYVTAVVFYLKLCFSITNFSSEDFRYISYLIVIEAAFAGAGLGSCPRWLRSAVYVLTAIFCIASSGVFVLMGIAPV